MSILITPPGYKSKLSIYETQKAIGDAKRIFEDNLSAALNLRRVSAPLFVEPTSGLNDNLSGKERPVDFNIVETGGTAEIVHSLAKWKRLALYKYKFPVGEGLYTDMNAIRREEELDNTHSIYVDQWDWELVINKNQRTEAFLRETVQKLVDIICGTHIALHARFPQLTSRLRNEVTFITSQELEDMYPNFDDKQREDAFTKIHKTVFIMKIGGILKSGKPHGTRSPDYDDWELNGDLIIWHETLGVSMEITSMGIRVDEKALDYQLKQSGCDDRREFPFHKLLLAGKLPLTIAGGLGQSRLCMLWLEKAHIGEVQVSVWDEQTLEGCRQAGIELL